MNPGKVGCNGYIAHPFSKWSVGTLERSRCDPSFPAFLPGSRSLREVLGCPDHEGFSASFPGTIHFVSSRDRFFTSSISMCQSGDVLLCWMRYLSHPFLTLHQEANTTGVLLTIDHLVACYAMLTSLPPFPAICPGTIRC